ncbi:hypothetical protein AQJ46_23665 [Streptomyces canus]|uniref:Uncharacterized protein n=1 Tax=Streptomyces canus TaxID=58343 RepID=A0A117R2H0_9ACTN|nr:hypothetical protein AQJ46_23665 [Streptomyces canus]
MVIGAGRRRTDRRHLPTLGLRTLLAERHNVPGGCATSFRRGRFEFETALHQLSGVGLQVSSRSTTCIAPWYPVDTM